MFCSSKRKEKKQKKINFQKNGSLLLEELIESSRGKYNPIRTFSSNQILQATNNFDRSNAICEGTFIWYKGVIENRSVLIKKFNGEHHKTSDNFYRDIAVSSMMSSHKNDLKLLGCCLEFPHPVLVCEYPENGALTIQGCAWAGIKPLPWNVRLKIAKEIADAVTYLHTEFPRIIVHRDLKIENIFLDENWTAKLTSFSLSIPIPEGDSGVDDMVVGTQGYCEPYYMKTGFVTENVDIYSLGIIMLRLLTGKPAYIHSSSGDLCKSPNSVEKFLEPEMLPDSVEKFLERGQFTELIDPSMMNSLDDNIPHHQMKAFLELALRCVRSTPGPDMPHMIDVAKELKQIVKQT